MAESGQRNFGRNITFTPRNIFDPEDEDDVCRLLEEHRYRKVRAIGSLHSWSDAPCGDDVVLRLGHLNEVRLASDGKTATIGAGCTVYDALRKLRKKGLTLPAVGMTGAQTIAGAIATATHGSGRSSMSHYVTSIRIAAYDGKGGAKVYEIRNGAPLRAARCSLGRMGIVLSVCVPVVPTFLVEERSMMLDSLEEVLTASRHHELTQFYLMPWSWKWIVEMRRQVRAPRSNFGARRLFQLKRWLRMRLLDKASALVASPELRHHAPAVYRMLTRGYRASSVIDRADRLLMIHHKQRYVEAELFVPTEWLLEAARFVLQVLRYLGGDAHPLSADVRDLIAFDRSMVASLEALRGAYVQHYPITFRRVEKDEASISMSSGGEKYAISLVTLGHDFETFREVVDLLSQTMSRGFGALPHWGKVLTFHHAALAGQLPLLAEFRRECESRDPNEVFTSQFTRRVLGF